MERKIILILLIFSIFSHCSSATNYYSIQSDLEKKDVFERTDVHSGLKGNFLFYVSNEDSQGDIWLYNLDSNSKWQLTSVDNRYLEVISHSTFYKYIIYYSGKKNIIYDVNNDEEMDFKKEFFNKKYHFSKFNNVNWVNEKKFYFLSSTNTNNKKNNIFIGQLNNEGEWSFERLFIENEFNDLNKGSVYSLSLSYNKNLLSFIASDFDKRKYIYILDLNNNRVKRLVSVKNISELIWSENNKDIFYYERDPLFNILYSINSRGAKNLVISQSKNFYTLVCYAKYKYKFFYITSLNDYNFIHIKNIDLPGTGDFLFNVQNLKNAALYQKSDLFYYDNNNNEIYYYNIKTTEIRKILDNASLIKLTY